MMTFDQQDAVLRDKAKRFKLRLRKNRLLPNTWVVYDKPRPTWNLFAHRVAYGNYNELLKFFEGIDYGRRNL